MSKERELLNRCAVTLNFREICPLLLTEISELLAQPETEPSSTKLQDRIKDYLSMGGLFNPELVNHGTVRDLILDARAEPPKQKPLSYEEITDLWANKSPANEFECVRLVEKAHGITGCGE